jgi:hypothetical protein
VNRITNRDSDLTAAMTRVSYAPRHLRAHARVTQSEMALRMRIPSRELRTLEDTSVALWEVTTLRAYLRALGYELRIAAVKAGKEVDVS